MRAEAEIKIPQLSDEQVRKVLSEIDPNKFVLTIWKDGSVTAWGTMDAFYSRGDPNYLSEISLTEMVRLHEHEFPGCERI